MNRLMIASLCMAGLLGVSACATPQTTGSTDAPASAATADAKPDRYCLRHTGSRIVARDNLSDRAPDFEKRCISANGRVYTREDIERTGTVDLAEALRRLDPSIH